jgi:hypothetical protein
LPRREAAVDVFGELLAFFGQLLDFGGDIDRAFVVDQAQFVNFGFEFGYGLFEVEKYFFSHGAVVLSTVYEGLHGQAGTSPD